MVDGLNNSGIIPIKVVYKGTANSSAEVEAVMKAANNDKKCVGIITWMHTFSPAKMWIKGLQALEKPLLHFHTQYNAELPWDSIDMDFMNLNQSAHGDIEFGHICTRMRIPRKVVVGYWKSEEAQKQIATWARVAAGVADAHNVRCLMFRYEHEQRSRNRWRPRRVRAALGLPCRLLPSIFTHGVLQEGNRC